MPVDYKNIFDEKLLRDVAYRGHGDETLYAMHYSLRLMAQHMHEDHGMTITEVGRALNVKRDVIKTLIK